MILNIVYLMRVIIITFIINVNYFLKTYMINHLNN